MPANKTTFKLDVSSDRPIAIVFGADKPGAQAFVNQLLDNNLRVIAVSSHAKTPSLATSKKDYLQIISPREWKVLANKKTKADYYIDFALTSEAVEEADKNNQKLLRVIGPSDNAIQEKEFLEKQNFDWRLVQGGHLYGPRDNIEQKGFLDHLFLAAVFNLYPSIAGSKKEIYPTFINDFAQGLFSALFSPSAKRSLISLKGEPITIAKFWQKIAEQAHTSSQTPYPVPIPPIEMINEQIKTGEEVLGWRPETSLEEGIKSSVQFFFQKMEKGEISKPTSSQLSARHSTNTKVKKKTKLKKKSKKSLLKAKPIIIEQEVKSVQKSPPKLATKPISAKPALGKRSPFPTTDKTDIQSAKPDRSDTEVKGPTSKTGRANLLLKKRLSGRWWAGSVLALVALFLFPLFWVSVNLTQGAIRLKSSVNYWQEGKFQKSINQASKAKASAERGKNFISAIDQPWFYLGQKKLLFAWLDVIEKSSWLTITVDNWSQGSSQLSTLVLGESNPQGQIKTIVPQLKADSEKLTTEFSLAAGSFSRAKALLPPATTSKLNPYQKKLDHYQKFLNYLQPSLRILDWMANRNKPLTFLVVLQNNMELRPTGGFIGSFALLKFDKGKMIDFKVHDVYSADGQLKGHVEPPEPIKAHLGEANWYLRDANWNPDFPSSAKNISWFLEKEINIKPDGVIAINLEAAKKILKKTGDIYLPDFNEKISDQNLFAKAEFYSEAGFFPGSSQKASFLSELFQQLLAEIKNHPDGTMISQALLASLEEKEIMAWTNYQEINQILEGNNWAGEIKNVIPAKDKTDADYLFVVESNLGVNKANYFLKRSLEALVNIDSNGKIEHTLKINYENSNQTDTWPGGDYKNYLRVILPSGSKVENIYTYAPSTSKKDSIDLNNVAQETIKGKQSLGFLVTVSTNSRKTVEINYSQKVDLGKENWRWLLYWQKQSGFRSTPITMLVTYPDKLKPLQVQPQATATSQGIVFNQFLDKDLVFGIEFGR